MINIDFGVAFPIVGSKLWIDLRVALPIIGSKHWFDLRRALPIALQQSTYQTILIINT